MKFFAVVMIFLGFFMFFFLFFSVLGFAFIVPEMKYIDIIRHGSWQYAYTLGLGWWIAGSITKEIYDNHIE